MTFETDLLRPALLALACLLGSGCNSPDAPPGDGAANAPPVIRGEPPPTARVGVPYAFTPEAIDDDGDLLAFTIANRPAWAEFDPATGTLQGTPRDEDVGDHRDILISVSDAASVVSLPAFSVAVEPPPAAGGSDGDDGPAAGTPTVSGEPNRYAVMGRVYAFLPEASDPDGDALSWSIVNQPGWADFDPATGRLQGTPTAADLGTTAPIRLAVTDGTGTAELPPFTITVEATGSAAFELAWLPPTENEDGTPLVNLAGYRVYYGTVTGSYTETIAIDLPGVTRYLIENLAPGRYFLVMTAVNSLGTESDYTPELEFSPGT